MQHFTLVTACVLIDAQRNIFVQQRPDGKSMAGLWEFPGGKIELHESPTVALQRELAEEIGITTALHDFIPLTFVTHRTANNDTDHDDLLLLLYYCTRWERTPISREHQAIDWVTLETLHTLDMPPADVPLLPHIAHLLADAG